MLTQTLIVVVERREEIRDNGANIYDNNIIYDKNGYIGYMIMTITVIIIVIYDNNNDNADFSR